VHKTAQERQLKYTHTSLVDGDAFKSIQIIGEAVLTGVQYAEGAEASADAKVKETAAKVKAFYTQFIPELDRIATASHVDFPIKGIPVVGEQTETVAQLEVEADSTVAVIETERSHASVDYVHHAQHELALIKDQLTRLTRNTDNEVQNFAKNQLPAVSELYTAIGGKEEAHAHH
jgi:hypothetical protein